MYVCDQVNNVIRKISKDGFVTTVAGVLKSRGNKDGPSSTATFSDPMGIALDKEGNLYISDFTSHNVRIIYNVAPPFKYDVLNSDFKKLIEQNSIDSKYAKSTCIISGCTFHLHPEILSIRGMKISTLV